VHLVKDIDVPCEGWTGVKEGYPKEWIPIPPDGASCQLAGQKGVSGNTMRECADIAAPNVVLSQATADQDSSHGQEPTKAALGL